MNRTRSERCALSKVQLLHYDYPMPRLMRFGSTEVAMFFADHPPPHFHVLGRDGAAQVAIETLEIIASSGRIDLRDALAWAEANRDMLRARWSELSGDRR